MCGCSVEASPAGGNWLKLSASDCSKSSGVLRGSAEAGVGAGHDFVLAVSSDEKLLTRLNELEGAETVSTSGKGTDGRWRLGVDWRSR